MSVPGQARAEKARQAFNLPALLIVALAHAALLNGALLPFGAERGAVPGAVPGPYSSVQVSLLPEAPLLPLLASSAASEAIPAKEAVQAVPASAQPASAAASNAAASNMGVPTYYPASALSQMPEVDGFFDVPVPPGLGLNGEVELRLWIDAAGKLDRIAVLSSQVPLSYQQAAVAAFQRMRYRPGQINGRPVAAFVDIVVEMNASDQPAAAVLP